MTDSEKKFVNSHNTARPDSSGNVYSSVISQIQKDGVCPFCKDQLEKYHKNPIIEDRTFWLATKNMYPYKNSSEHLLLIHKEHIDSIEKITAPAWTELQDLIKFLITQRHIPGGTFFIRFGDTRNTGASVTHLHGHIVSSNPDDPAYSPVVTRVA